MARVSKSFNNINFTGNHRISDYDIANVHSLINNYSSPGLNRILETYEPSKKTNYLKDKMHNLMSSNKYKYKLFTERPLDKEFLLYSIMDVQYLITSLRNMEDELKKKISSFYPDNNNLDYQLILRLLSDDHKKKYCFYNKQQKFEVI